MEIEQKVEPDASRKGMDCSSDNSANQFKANTPPQDFQRAHEEMDSEEDKSRSPDTNMVSSLTAEDSLLAELDSTPMPMRVTRSMRTAFKSLGLEKKVQTQNSVVVSKTGKRAVAKGGKSQSDDDDDYECTTRRRKGKAKGAQKGGKKSPQKKAAENGEADSGQDVSSGVTNEKVLQTNAKCSPVGWVMCDDCRKWRCIPSELADSIEASDARWTCKDNPNTKYSDCSIPQEKTNAEINAELDISDISSEGDENEVAVNSKSRVSWTQIKHNIFQHRRPKQLDDDETLICHCKPPDDGGPGCKDDCLNRMMNVECSPDTCPCGDRCSNQQFGRRMYARVQLVRCGKKGFGLRTVESIPKGTFIIEYVGEVLDNRAFESRQKEYARQGQKHFYFMTLNSNEVIDACRKGNLGRFINHSCDPNCQTEKWCVNGEICIGLFAIRDLVQNEEITFNYNFERLYGAAARKCHCGSTTCQGYIGGDPSNPQDVVQSDSEEDMEPIMLKEDESEDESAVHVETSTVVCAQSVPDTKPPVPSVPETSKSVPSPQASEIVPKPKITMVTATKCRVKRVKDTSRPRKAPLRHFAFVRRPEKSSRSEVQEKLDKLLNEQGGLVKKKDIPKQYLKLLVISTASGDASTEGTTLSMRDLSLLLDAILKTQSRSILTEVIQKNGLQLLHNLVKQSRKTFAKIPILRKLIKVLESLAEKNVLKSKDMTSTPPRYGMESFAKSIFELTRHEDMEVCQLSRRFQKNYLPNMYDLLRNDKNHYRHWGPDRFSQKRELFREDNHRKPPVLCEENERKENHRKPHLFPGFPEQKERKDREENHRKPPGFLTENEKIESDRKPTPRRSIEEHRNEEDRREKDVFKHDHRKEDDVHIKEEDERNHMEPERKRRKIVSRWDELPPSVDARHDRRSLEHLPIRDDTTHCDKINRWENRGVCRNVDRSGPRPVERLTPGSPFNDDSRCMPPSRLNEHRRSDFDDPRYPHDPRTDYEARWHQNDRRGSWNGPPNYRTNHRPYANRHSQDLYQHYSRHPVNGCFRPPFRNNPHYDETNSSHFGEPRSPRFNGGYPQDPKAVYPQDPKFSGGHYGPPQYDNGHYGTPYDRPPSPTEYYDEYTQPIHYGYDRPRTKSPYTPSQVRNGHYNHPPEDIKSTQFRNGYHMDMKAARNGFHENTHARNGHYNHVWNEGRDSKGRYHEEEPPVPGL